MSLATDKISMSAMNCSDHVECWQEYNESGMIVRLMMTETDMEEMISVAQQVLAEMVEIRLENGYSK